MPRYVYSRTLTGGSAGAPTTRDERSTGWGRVASDTVIPLAGTPFESLDLPATGDPVPLANLALDAPAWPTAKIVCAARNYRKHADELSNPVPSEPLVFLKPYSALIGHDAPIELPTDQSGLVHHEGELAVVIGRRTRRVPSTAVDDHILGYTLFNDVTARDLQRRDGGFTRAKGFDTFAPLGPWIDTDFRVSSQRLCVTVNDQLRQDGALDEMLFDVTTLVSWVSHVMTLEPGDIIATGTPAGVGELQPGDTVRVEIEGLGALTNPVIARG